MAVSGWSTPRSFSTQRQRLALQQLGLLGLGQGAERLGEVRQVLGVQHGGRRGRRPGGSPGPAARAARPRRGRRRPPCSRARSLKDGHEHRRAIADLGGEPVAGVLEVFAARAGSGRRPARTGRASGACAAWRGCPRRGAPAGSGAPGGTAGRPRRGGPSPGRPMARPCRLWARSGWSSPSCCWRISRARWKRCSAVPRSPVWWCSPARSCRAAAYSGCSSPWVRSKMSMT